MRAKLVLQIAAPVLLLSTGACSVFGVGPCEADPDVSGPWTFQLSPPDDDGGTPVIPRDDTVSATLEQHPTGGLQVGELLWGTLSSSDTGFFPPLTIPRLTHNSGSKTGAELGCTVRINVPTAPTMSVTDDETPQDPLRVSFAGTIVGKGQIVGDPNLSTVIMVDDPTQTARRFAWTGTR